jgi:heme exporter protein D
MGSTRIKYLRQAHMIWSSFSDFIVMHGYGPYVWGSFGVTFFLFFLEYTNLQKKRQQLTQQVPS